MNRRAPSRRWFCVAAKLFLVLLAASQIAAAMEITSCGVITQAGEHYLTHDITSSGGACLTITGSPGVLEGVTLDCRGFKILSSRGGTGIILGQANGATIQNCGIEGFDTGINLRFSFCDGFGGRPVVVAGQRITVRDNTISGADTGIIVERSNTCSNGYVFEDTLWCGNMYALDACDVDFTGSNTATISGNAITAASCYSIRDPCDVNGFPKWCPPELFDPPNPYLCMYQGSAETCHSYDEMSNYGNTCNGGSGSGAPPPPLGELEIPACGDEIKPVPVPQLPSEECTQLEVCNNAGDYKIEGDTTPIPYCTPAYSQPPDYSCACPGHCDCGESCLDCNIGYVPPAVNYANNELPIVQGQGRDYPGSDVDKGICWNKPIDVEINDTDVASFFYVDSGISKMGVWPTFIRYRDDTDILGNPIRLPDAYCANVTVCGQLTKPFRLTVTRWEPQPIDYSETNNPEVTPAQCGTSCFDGDDPEACPGCQCPVPKAYVCGKVPGSTTNVDYWALEQQAPVCDCSGDYCEGQIDSFMTDPDCDPGQGDICSYYTGPYDTACCHGTTYYSHYTIGFPDSPKNVIPADPEFQELCAYGGIPRGHEPCAPGYVCTPDVDFGEGSNSSLYLDYYVSYANNARTPYVYRALDDFDKESGVVDSEKLYNVTVNVSDIYHQWPYDVERVPLELLPGFATWSQAIFGGVPNPPYADARMCTELGNNASCPAYDIAPGGANPVERNNYRDPRLNNFFRGQVKVKQVIEYFYNRKNESDLRNITVDGTPGGVLRYLSPEECTVEGLRYNSTAAAPGLCPPPNKLSAWPCCEEDPAGTMYDEARCFCVWTFNDCDRGNHTFRLVAYEDIYVGDQVAAQDNAAGNLFPGIRRVNKIYNYFYVSGREEYNSSVNVTVRHNTTEMSMRVKIPPAAVASTATNFPGNVTVLNKYSDLDENYTKYAYIWAVPSDPVADGGAPYQFNVTYAKNKSACEVFNLVDPLRTDFTCNREKTEAMKNIQAQTGFPDTYCCNIENGTMAFNMSISRPGDFEVTATNQTFGEVGVQPATGYAAITITAEPKNITLTLPPKTLKNVEFVARAYVSDAAGKALKGYAYTFSIHFEDEAHNTVGHAYARLPGGEPSSSFSCPVDPALGYCEFLVNATQNGILLANATCDGCDLSSGENATLVLNTNCYDGTVNPPANKTEENVTVINPDGSEVLYYPDVNAVDAANNAAGDRLIGWDGQRMNGNDDVCAVGYSEIPVRWCIVDDPAAGELQGTGQFDGEAGILCVKGFTYTPQIDGEISDHLNFNGTDVSDDYMRATFRYPRIVWGWGVSAMGKNGNPLGSELDSLYAITPVYFNLSVQLNANISLSSFNMTNDTVMPGSGSGVLNPFEIRGPSAMLTLDKEGYISRYDYPYDFSASGYPGKRFETYPQPGLDDVFRKNPQGMAEDKRGNFYVADSKGGSLYYFKLARQDSGNVIKLIGRVPEQGSLYAHAERNTRTTSTGELADPFSVDYSGPYHPFGVAIDSYNRIFIVGLTEPDNVNCDPLGLTCGKVVIQILNPDWSVNASYARNAPSIIGYSNFNPEQGSQYIRDRADIAVAGDGSEIYIVYGTDSLMMLRFDGEVISSFQNIPLYMPCRQLGSGCWDSNIAGSPPLDYGEGYCYWAAPAWMSGANQPTFSESVSGLKPLFLDANLECGANNCDSSGICLNPYVEIGEGFISFFSPAVKPFGEGKGVCVDDKYLFTPERDGPNTADDIIGQTAGLVSFRRYHQGVAVAYKDGYIFVVDRFTFERREGFGRPGLTQRCDWAKTGGCLGCTSVDLFAFTFRQLSYGEAIFGEGDAQGSASCNYCGDDNTKYKRTENWVRIYYEDEYGNVKPAMHLVIKKSVYTGDYSTLSGEGFSTVTDALWGGLTASGTGLEEKGGMGWDFSVGGAFGLVEKLDITDDDNARVDGIDVYGGSGNYDIYLPVRDSEKTKPDWEGVWRVKVTGLQVSEDFKDVQGSVSAATQLVGKTTDPGLRGPTDVLVYEDVLRKNLPYGVYCEGCPDRAGIPMSVCRRQQAVAGSSIAAGRSASAGLSATVPNITRKYFAQFYVDTVVEGAVNISYNGGKIWGIAHGVAPVLHALYEGGTFKLAFQTPYRSEKEACVRDSQCQGGAVCLGGACAPEVYPSLEYLAYSSRLFTKHFVAFDNVNGSANLLMVNSSFRYNYTRYRNALYGYQYLNSSPDAYENVSPKDPAAPRYDVNALKYFDLGKDPWWAGYNRTMLDWVFSKDYKLYNTSPIPPDATLMLKPVPNRVSNVTALSFVGANGTNNAISASVSITGSFEPGTHKFVPDAEAYPFRYADATNTGFKDITEVGGTGGGFGDEYELWTDPGQAEVVIGTIFIPGAGFQGSPTFSADPGSLVPMVAGSARNVKVSSHENVCCNHTFVSQDASTHVFHSQDLCILAVSGSEQQNRDALDAACKALSDVTPDKQGKCVAGSVDLNPPWTRCEANGMVTCLCEYNTTRRETVYRYPREGMSQCARCDLGSPSASLDCHTAAPCDSQGWYSQNGGSGTMTLIGLNGDGQLDSEELYLSGSQGAFVASGIPWRAIYYIRLESAGSFEGEGGFANDSIEFWSGGSGPAQLLTTLADVVNDTYAASASLGTVRGAQGSQLVVHTNRSGSTARVTIMGVDASGQRVTASGVSADGGSTGVAFAEVFRVEIEGGDNEMISVTTSGGSGGGKLGVIRVEPLKFHPTTYQNASGIYLFSNLDSASLLVMDEAVLGQHNASFAFYDRFNNTFIWNQSFDFRLPTTVNLVPETVRDAADGNKTLVCLTAKLLAKYIDEPDSISTHPLGNKTIRFYEAGAVINPEDYNEYTNDSIYVQENNDGAGGCSCDPDTGCSTSDGQIPCTSSSECVRQSVNGITNAQPHCAYTTKCFEDSDCGESGACVVAVEFYGKPCNENVDCGCEPGGDDSCTQACNLKTNTCAKKCTADSACGLNGKCSGGLCGTASKVCQDSGRCLNNFGWVGDNKTCSEDGEAGGCVEGEATYCYTVCGWGKHTAVAAFKPNMSDPIEARYGRSQDVKTYQSGGFPLDLGTLSILLPLLLILLALAGKLFLDWQAGALRGKTAGSRK